MQSLKKLLVGLAVLIVMAVGFMAMPKSALAAGNAQSSDLLSCIQSVKFKDIAHVTCNFGGSTYTFFDKYPTDGKYNFAPPSGVFCGTDNQADSQQDPQGFNLYHDSQRNGWYGVLTEGYITPNQNGCKSFGLWLSTSKSPGLVTGAFVATVRPNILLQGTSTGAESLPDVSKGVLAGHSFGRWESKYDPNGSTFLFAENINLNNLSGGTCTGNILAVTAQNDTSVSAMEYSLGGSGNKFSKYSDLSKLPNTPNCYVNQENFGLGKTHIYFNPQITSISSIVTGSGSTTGSGPNNPNSAEDNCIGVASTSLNWLICPVIAGMSETADTINGFVSGQLNINVSQNFGNKSGSNDSIYNAWSVLKDLVSVLLVIIMLVMVISQAVGGGQLFDAYTVKKVLPKLIIAVIGMQLSWDILIWIIGLFNDVGQGTADILARPFGGQAALDLPALMHRLSPLWAELFSSPLPVADVSLSGLIIIIGGFLFWPMLLLGAFLAIMAVITAMATLLVRNAILILGVIVAPVALVSWVLPGTQKFWKYWYSNMSKALMLFPLVMGIITGGRIFAWVAGNLGHAGPLDAIMVFVGFLGPYYFLPKTFKYGGTILSQASQGINKIRDQVNKRPKEYMGGVQKSWNELRGARSAHRYAHPEEYKNPDGSRKVSSLWNRPLDKMKSGDWNPLLGAPRSELRTRQRGAFLSKGNEYVSQGEKEALLRATKLDERLQEGRETDATGAVLAKKGGNKDDMWQDVLRVARGEQAMKKYYDYDGNEIDLQRDFVGQGERAHSVARRAALDRMIELGADTNFTHILAEDERVKKSGTAAEKTAWRNFLNDNKEVVLEKMPQLLKGKASVSDISASGISRMHGAAIKHMISTLDFDATDMATRAGENAQTADARRTTAKARLGKFLSTYSEALSNPNLRGNLEQGGLRAVKAYVARNQDDRKFLLDEAPYRIHADLEDGLKQVREHVQINAAGATQYSGDLLFHPLIDAAPDGSVSGNAAAGLAGLPASLRDTLDQEITRSGSFREKDRPLQPEELTPGVIRIQHTEAAARVLPGPATIAAAGAQREAFKFQLQTSPNAVQVLAHNIAYESAPPEYQSVLEEMRQSAVATGTPEAKNAYNQMVLQIQQALQQRIDETASAAAARGRDAAAARTAAAGRLAPRIIGLEANAAAPATGTPDLRKLP